MAGIAELMSKEDMDGIVENVAKTEAAKTALLAELENNPTAYDTAADIAIKRTTGRLSAGEANAQLALLKDGKSDVYKIFIDRTVREASDRTIRAISSAKKEDRGMVITSDGVAAFDPKDTMPEALFNSINPKGDRERMESFYNGGRAAAIVAMNATPDGKISDSTIKALAKEVVEANTSTARKIGHGTNSVIKNLLTGVGTIGGGAVGLGVGAAAAGAKKAFLLLPGRKHDTLEAIKGMKAQPTSIAALKEANDYGDEVGSKAFKTVALFTGGGAVGFGAAMRRLAGIPGRALGIKDAQAEDLKAAEAGLRAVFEEQGIEVTPPIVVETAKDENAKPTVTEMGTALAEDKTHIDILVLQTALMNTSLETAERQKALAELAAHYSAAQSSTTVDIDRSSIEPDGAKYENADIAVMPKVEAGDLDQQRLIAEQIVKDAQAAGIKDVALITVKDSDGKERVAIAGLTGAKATAFYNAREATPSTTEEVTLAAPEAKAAPELRIAIGPDEAAADMSTVSRPTSLGSSNLDAIKAIGILAAQFEGDERTTELLAALADRVVTKKINLPANPLAGVRMETVEAAEPTPGLAPVISLDDRRAAKATAPGEKPVRPGALLG